ncbi:hypothetical protein IJO12_00965 [bacterium]|nr:hypothetical protein [bacterium]
MFLSNLFNFKKKCSHDKISINADSAYCPDCGKLVHNEWYLTRCSCCGIKLKTTITNDKIRPFNHYCTNCGSEEYEIEKLSQINFIDINFAVLKRKADDQDLLSTPTTFQCWQEKMSELPRLPVQYR